MILGYLIAGIALLVLFVLYKIFICNHFMMIRGVTWNLCMIIIPAVLIIGGVICIFLGIKGACC